MGKTNVFWPKWRVQFDFCQPNGNIDNIKFSKNSWDRTNASRADHVLYINGFDHFYRLLIMEIVFSEYWYHWKQSIRPRLQPKRTAILKQVFHRFFLSYRYWAFVFFPCSFFFSFCSRSSSTSFSRFWEKRPISDIHLFPDSLLQRSFDFPTGHHSFTVVRVTNLFFKT